MTLPDEQEIQRRLAAAADTAWRAAVNHVDTADEILSRARYFSDLARAAANEHLALAQAYLAAGGFGEDWTAFDTLELPMAGDPRGSRTRASETPGGFSVYANWDTELEITFDSEESDEDEEWGEDD